MSMLYIIPLLIIFFILMQGFFSNSEMAMVSANKIKFNSLSKSGNKNASIILKFLNQPEQIFGTTLVGINFATVIATIVSEYYFHDVFLKHFPIVEKFITSEMLTFLIMEPAILIFGELFPMSIAQKYPNITCLRNAKLIGISYILFFPLTIIITNIGKTIGKLLKTGETEFGKLSRGELEILMSGKYHQITEKTRKIIEDVFDINELTAKDVMTHLNEVKEIQSNATVGELKKLIAESNFSRIPVFDETVFNIVATIHAVSILGIDDNEHIMPFTEKLYIIPSSKPVVQVLSDLKRNRKYMGIVVDEYVIVAGILTIENIAEELIGEIKDEFEKEEEKPNTDKNTFEAKMFLDDFYEKTGIDFTDEDVQTLAGIINLTLGRIGRKGDKVYYKDIEFEIIEATDRVVKKIKLLNNIEKKKEIDKEAFANSFD